MRAGDYVGGRCRRRWPGIGFAAIVVLYALVIVWLRPAANFGTIQDDAFYFASAKAIAAGQGYILPSFPGGLSGTRYPELYPWLLSWIWRADPHFPGNVIPAIGLTVVFGCWFLAACFLVAKKTMGLGDGWSLVVVALCGFNFFALLVGGSVLSDMPFAAMMLTAALAADRALEPGARAATGWWTAAAVALAGLSVGLRSVGAAIVAGMVLIALVRRAYVRALVFGVAAGALALPWLLPAMLRAMAARPHSAPLPQGWAQTLAFYTSYIGVWRQFVPNWATQQAVCVKNLLNLASEPGILLLQPLVNGSPLLTAVGVSLVAIASWAGIVVGLRRRGLRAIHAILLLYIALIVPWPFPPHRFFLPFLPLVFGGLAVMARDVAAKAASEFRRFPQFGTRAAAAALMLVLVAVGVLAAANYVHAAPRQLAGVMAAQRSLLVEKRQAYAWIRQHTPPQAGFIAYDDVLLYLYTGRQAVRPIACSTASFYRNDPAPALADAAHLGDVARQVDARYWVESGADFSAELGEDQDVMDRREARMLGSLPELFRSTGERVRIYDLRCFQDPAACPERCRGAAGCPGTPQDRGQGTGDR